MHCVEVEVVGVVALHTASPVEEGILVGTDTGKFGGVIGPAKLALDTVTGSRIPISRQDTSHAFLAVELGLFRRTVNTLLGS